MKRKTTPAPRPWGNRYHSRKADLLGLLHEARVALASGMTDWAKQSINQWRSRMSRVPASTRRRWKCGQ